MQSSKKILAALLFVPIVAIAQPSPPSGVVAPPPAPSHASTVEALLVLDSQIAMEKLNAQAAKAAPPPPATGGAQAAAAPAPEVIEVISILGIGSEKRAVLSIDGKRYSQLAEGSKAGRYVVQSVGGGCVSLSATSAKASSKSRAASKSKPKSKKVCFDPDADADLMAAPAGAAGYGGQTGGGIQTRMTIAPLPLPVVPAPMAVRVNPQ